MFELPESLVIADVEYPIETSWRIWAEVGTLFEKKDDVKALSKALLLVFKGNKIPRLKDALNEILFFYRRGKKEQNSSKKEEPVFDLVYDFPLLNAAFLSQYRINLRKSNMHWWEFWELFEGLKKDEKIIKVIGYRSSNLNEIKNDEEKKHIRKMKELYKLPSRKTLFTSEEIGFELDKLM